MAVENFEQILQSINNSEIRIALEKLFALAGIGTGSDGSSLSQDVVGDVTGDVTGNVTGDVTGDVTGTVTGGVNLTSMKLTAEVHVADGTLDGTESWVQLDANAAAVGLTLAAPVPGQMTIFECVDASNAVTVTLTAGDFDGAAGNVATFDAAEECLVVFAISATRMIIIENVGAVALS